MSSRLTGCERTVGIEAAELARRRERSAVLTRLRSSCDRLRWMPAVERVLAVLKLSAARGKRTRGATPASLRSMTPAPESRGRDRSRVGRGVVLGQVVVLARQLSLEGGRVVVLRPARSGDVVRVAGCRVTVRDVLGGALLRLLLLRVGGV